MDFDQIVDNEQLPVAQTAMDIDGARNSLMAFHRQVEEIATRAKDIAVTDDASASEATGIGTQAKKLAKMIDTKGKEIRGPADEFSKAIRGIVASFLDPLKVAEDNAKRKINLWQVEQERIRREAEAKARREAEELRRNIEAEQAAERKRLEDEARAKAMAEAKAAGESAKAAKAAAEAAAAAVEVPAPVIVPDIVMPSTTSTKRTETGTAFISRRWAWELTDAGQVPRQYLKIDDVAINRAVRDGIRQIAGINIFEATETKFRSA